MFTTEEIRIANATSRSSGASARNKDGSLRAVVPKYVESIARKEDKILDYGAGKWAIHTLHLREQGFDCTAYDFGENVKHWIHDENALDKQYDIVFASNVLNVCCNRTMLINTVKEIYNATKENGVAVMNYPSNPRKNLFDAASMTHVVEDIFKCKSERVGGTKSAPVLKIRKEGK